MQNSSLLQVSLLASLAACQSSPETSHPAPSKPASGPSKSGPASQAAVSKSSASGLELGAALPVATVSMKNVDGKQMSLNDLKKDNGLLVVFTCNHCPYAKAWEERIAAIGNEYLDKGIGVAAVNPNDPTIKAEDSFDNMVKRSKKLGFRFPYLVDETSNVARAFGATKTPEVFLFNEAGKLAYHGAVDDAHEAEKVESNYLIDALNQMLAHQPVAKPDTRSVGCSIKFRPQS